MFLLDQCLFLISWSDALATRAPGDGAVSASVVPWAKDDETCVSVVDAG